MPRPQSSALTDASTLDLSPVHVPGESAVVDALTVIVQRARSRAVQGDIMREIGFPAPDFTAFAALDHLSYHGAQRPSHLAKSLDLAPSGVTKVVRRLIDLGLVAQTADPHDGRGSVIALTAAGRVYGTQIVAYAHRHLTSELAGWDPGEAAEFSRLLSKFTAGAYGFEALLPAAAQ